MTDSDDQAHAGTAAGQGPVRVDEDLARHLDNKREELFEQFEIRDEFPREVLEQAEERAADPAGDIEAELDERRERVADLELLEQFLALVLEVPGEVLVDADRPLARRGAGVRLVVAVGHAVA